MSRRAAISTRKPALDKEPAHLILLAENNIGYRNLMKLVSIGFTEGFYYRPRIDQDLLASYMRRADRRFRPAWAARSPRLILQQDLERAREPGLADGRHLWPRQFFPGTAANQIPDQNLVNSALIQISQETGIPLVATNDCHYLTQEDAKAHEVLLCMQTGKRMSDDDRMRMETDEFYVKSPEEMAEAFAAVPEALANTARIAERCTVDAGIQQNPPAGIRCPGRTEP